MPLKDRLKLNNETDNLQEVLVETPQKKESFFDKIFSEILNQDINVLVYCDINLPTYSAINYLCSKIECDKRLVGIGSNLLLNPNEIIKFEPETKNQSKELIKTAISLKPYKIILQDFDGVEAVDIFKLINAGIKNVISAVNAKTPEKALSQMELNLYMNGVQIPQGLMKTLIAEFVGKIIYIEKTNENIEIKNIYNVEYNEKGYKISEIPKIKKNSDTKTKSEDKAKSVVIDVIEKPVRKNILATKLKKRRLSQNNI